MFCILEIKERKKRLFHKNPPYSAVKTVIPKTAVFENITVFSYSGKCDFYSVREHLKSFSKSVILAENCTLPDSSGIFEFSSNDLRARMTLNSALFLLEGIKKKRDVSLVIADKAGSFSAFAEEFVPLAGRVKVITESLLRYNYASQEIFEDYGAVVSVDGWTACVPDADVFVSLSSSGFSPMSVTVKNRTQNSFITLEGDTFLLPECYEKYRNVNVSPYSFASALYSLSSVRELGEMKYNSFTVNGRQITLDSAVKMLDTLFNI